MLGVNMIVAVTNMHLCFCKPLHAEIEGSKGISSLSYTTTLSPILSLTKRVDGQQLVLSFCLLCFIQ